MKALPDGSFRYSPRDLIAYLDGDFAAWCERMYAEGQRTNGARSAAAPSWAAEPDAQDEEMKLAATKGDEHERRYLEQLRTQYPGMVEFGRNDADGESRTMEAIAAHAPVIYQAHLANDGWGGFPDFLYLCGGDDGCGGRHYTPWDTKLARSAKPAFLIQLCAYADMLEGMHGFRPTEVVFVFGGGEVRRFSTRDYFHYYRQLRRAFAAFQSEWDPARRPEPGLDRSWGRWEATAEGLLRESDHLSLVATITRGQVRRLEDAGIATMTALGGCDGGRRVPKVTDAVFQRLRDQARLQIESRGLDQPRWVQRPPDPDEPRRGLALLPLPSAGDVFFDMEGFPYSAGGLEYLFGAVTVGENGESEFHDWWAHDDREERAAFEGFMDWLSARRTRYPDLHVYHYAAYEQTAVKKLMGKYATREDLVDDLLRADVFVDLYKVVKQGFVIGTPSYSLKEVEHLYLDERTGSVFSAGGSIVEYQRWIDSGEPRKWPESPVLQGIREYNRVDCESVLGLRSWLLERQRESGLAFMPDPLRTEAPAPSPERVAAEALADRLVQRGLGREETELGTGGLDQLIGWLVEFHRREEKPMWWRMFARHDMTVEERFDDRDCLAALRKTDRPDRQITRQSRGYEYQYDLAQETKVKVGDRCFVANEEMIAEIVRLDEDLGLVELKSTKQLPDRMCLIPDEFVRADVIKKAIARYAAAWERGEVASRAVDDLLQRRPPRVAGHAGGPLVPADADLVERTCEIAAKLDDTTLCIQGPPGSGKTFTAAAVIVELLRNGARVGITAQSHKVIMHAIGAVAKALEEAGIAASLYKVGYDEVDKLVEDGIVQILENDEVPGALDAGPCLVGGTAWLFSREELTGRFDYLVIDEAGQVSLANAVAMGLCARNLILVGDQMQLAQVTKGHHPGDTGLSCLEYLLHGSATVPDDRGIFLRESRRMHPGVCRFISEAVYEGKLGNLPATERHRVIRRPQTTLVPAETGIVWMPVPHDGRTQSSEEEAELIQTIVVELLGRRVVGRDGVERPMTLRDILVVAPFNLQVRALKAVLDPAIRVGSVDKFQGQEAPVVIVSLCSSTLEDSPRGASFLLSPNRLNVAVSRAEALAIVVGCPELMDVRCHSLEEMKLVNLLCHLVHYAEDQALELAAR